MCVYSLVVDHYTDKWWERLGPGNATPITQPSITINYPPPPSPEEIAEFRKLLERAREYDKKNNQPDCDLESKKAALRDIAQHWGIDISFIDKV